MGDGNGGGGDVDVRTEEVLPWRNEVGEPEAGTASTLDDSGLEDGTLGFLDDSGAQVSMQGTADRFLITQAFVFLPKQFLLMCP